MNIKKLKAASNGMSTDTTSNQSSCIDNLYTTKKEHVDKMVSAINRLNDDDIDDKLSEYFASAYDNGEDISDSFMIKANFNMRAKVSHNEKDVNIQSSLRLHAGYVELFKYEHINDRTVFTKSACSEMNYLVNSPEFDDSIELTSDKTIKNIMTDDDFNAIIIALANKLEQYGLKIFNYKIENGEDFDMKELYIRVKNPLSEVF